MNETKHTPGPWRIDHTIRRGSDGGKHAFVEVSGPELFWVAKVQTFDDDKGKYAANARLIATAPDGYNLAKRFIEFCAGNGLVSREVEILRMAEELVSKVEGRQ
jgi:hypothetical protein